MARRAVRSQAEGGRLREGRSGRTSTSSTSGHGFKLLIETADRRLASGEADKEPGPSPGT